MKDVSVFLRRFLLLVFYANISTTSPVHLEGASDRKTMSSSSVPAVVKDRWSGPSRAEQLHYAEPTSSERKQSMLSSQAAGRDLLLAMTHSSSPRLTSQRLQDAGMDEDYQSDEGKEDEEEEEDEEEDEERRTQTDERSHPPFSRGNCRKRLDVEIESCLDGYERMLRNINPKEQLNDSLKLELCHEYEKTMQCLHLSFSVCRPRHLHLQLIAYRLGYLRTFMEQTCDQIGDENDDESEQEEEEEEEDVEKEKEGEAATDDKDDNRDHNSPPFHSPPIPDLSSSVVPANRPQMDRPEIGSAAAATITTTLRGLTSSTVNQLKTMLAGTGSASTASYIAQPSDVSTSRTVVVEPICSTSPSSASQSPSSSSSSSSSATTSSSVVRSVALGASASTHHHVTNGDCGDALSCGGRESDEDNKQQQQQQQQQQRTSLRMPIPSSQHPTTGTLAAIFPTVVLLLNSSSTSFSRSFNGGQRLDGGRGGTAEAAEAEASTVALRSPFRSASPSSTGDETTTTMTTTTTTQTGSLVTVSSSSVGGSNAAQCRPGETCSRTNSAGNGIRGHHLLDYCLALSVIMLLVRSVISVSETELKELPCQ